jgi:acylglycerol lipase
MPTEVEGTHQIGDVSLYTKTWKASLRFQSIPALFTDTTQPDGPPVAKVIFIHGFNDHINRYYELFPDLVAKGIEVYGFDQRGWGKSVKKPADMGKTGPTSLVMSDIVSFVKTVLPSKVPVFIMGHSMGGGEIIYLAGDPLYADLAPQIRGWLLESPFVYFTSESQPSSLTVFFGKLGARVAPNVRLYQAPPPENVTRDPAVVKSLKEDKLLHGAGTLEGLAGMVQRTDDIHSGKVKMNKGVKAIWLGHGTADKGTSYQASKRWFDAQTSVADKEFKTYEGWSHQLHADSPDNRAVFSKDVADWILARVGEEKPVDSKL